jgi:hypothetical protein
MLDKTILIDYLNENVSTQTLKQNSKTPEFKTLLGFFTWLANYTTFSL